jgi:hypothetical protein
LTASHPGGIIEYCYGSKQSQEIQTVPLPNPTGSSLTKDLLIGATGSLIATIAWISATYFISKYFRDRLIRFIFRLLGAGIEFVYPNHSRAENDIVVELKKAEKIRILSMRGRSLAEGYLSFIIREPPFREVKALLADPDAPVEYNPLVLRAREIKKTEHTLSPESFIDEGRMTVRNIHEINGNQNLKIKLYRFPALFRMISTDSTMFLSFYPSVGRARDNVIFRIPHGSPFYTMLSKYFDCIWDDPRTRDPLPSK